MGNLKNTSNDNKEFGIVISIVCALQLNCVI